MQAPMCYPDEDLPGEQLSLKQFVSIAQHLFTSSHELDSFVRFVLAGRVKCGGELRRIFVNARQGTSPPPIREYELRRDIDSAIGITYDLPFASAMAIFPLPSFRDTLKDDNHLTHPVLDPAGAVIRVPLHKIPNLALGTVERRQITRVFFPRMHKPGSSPAVSTEILTLVYEKCLRPSVVDANPLDQSRWPTTYMAAMTQCRDKRGQFHFCTIDIPSRMLGSFSAKLLERFGAHVELRDAFFLHEFRGTKGASLHNPYNETERREALNCVFRTLDTEKLVLGDWFVDVAVEVRHKDHVLQWLTIGHHRILELVLPSATPDQINAILDSKVQYKCDLSAQLQDLGGFRAKPGSRGKADKVLYINVYTTDKSATYQLHEGIFRRRKPWHLFPIGIKMLIKDVEKIAQTFHSCGGTQPGNGLEGNARLELRVPLTLVDQVLLGLPENFIQETIVAYDCQEFWFFKYYRIAALYCVINGLHDAPPDARLQAPSLALGAIIMYQVNALIYRPAEGRGETVLLAAACQHLPGDGDGDVTRPTLYSRGLYFLSDVVHDEGGYHLPNIRPIDLGILADLYRRKSFEEVKEEFNIPRVQGTSKGVHKTLSLHKRKLTSDVEHAHGDDTFTDGCSETLQFTPTVALKPSCLTYDMGGLTIKLSQILRQFPSDVFQLAPKRKGEPKTPWVLLNPEERSRIKIDVFKSLSLDKIFDQVQYQIVDKEKWRNLVFGRYFPAKGTQMDNSLQNFPSARYYTQWLDLLNQLSNIDSTIVREQAFVAFSELLWIPYPGSDRMWVTKAMKGWIAVPICGGRPQLGPQLAINAELYRGRTITVRKCTELETRDLGEEKE